MSRQFHEMLVSIAGTNGRLGTLVPSKCSVSTMTVCGKLGADDIQQEIAEISSPTKRARNASFYNQVTVEILGVSLKLFGNGSIQATGVKSPVHFVDVIDTACRDLLDGAQLQTVEVALINVVFTAGILLPLGTLRHVFERAGHDASYDPEVYPGVSVKVVDGSRRVTVIIFASGSISILGAKTPENVSNVYDVVCTVIDDEDAKTSTTAATKALIRTGNPETVLRM